jgi:hypothetical protein
MTKKIVEECKYKTAKQLTITEEQRKALIKTLKYLQADKMKHIPNTNNFTSYNEDDVYGLVRKHKPKKFNLSVWIGTDLSSAHSCGTVCCIGGTAESLVGAKIFGDDWSQNRRLSALFSPMHVTMHKVTPEQAAVALHNFLVTGWPHWKDAIKAA